MKRSGVNIFFFGLLSLSATLAVAAGPTTPQTYCASLPAVSCEILNFELNACGVSGYCPGVIKYCRNRVFKLSFFTMTAVNTPETRVTIRDASTGTTKYISGGDTTSLDLSLSHTTLCTYVP